MKTRQEMIYDFMLALAPNAAVWEQVILEMEEEVSAEDVAETILAFATALTDAYLENLQ
jgi:hypothetical protein